jgi:predicted nucleic acid-binding protein
MDKKLLEEFSGDTLSVIKLKNEKNVGKKLKSLYIETTIPSYATSRGSSNLIIAARQLLTRQFWEEEREKFDLYTSQYVFDECELGDKEVAKRRFDFISGIRTIAKTDEIASLANIYFNLLKIPERAKTDCFHLAVCVVTKIDYLLSWNCTHLGVNTYKKVLEYNIKHDLWTPLLVTPDYFSNLTEEEKL